jgi:hypothetical protein
VATWFPLTVDIDPVPSAVEASKKATNPVGVPPAELDTVAVKVTD